MKIYYITTKSEPVFHGKVFTTEKLALQYLSEDTTCNYKLGVWTDKKSGEEVARLCTATLNVE